MTVSNLLADLRTRDIHVWIDGDQLKVNAQTGALTPELQEQLRQHKIEILEFLRAPVDLSFPQQRLWFLDQIEMVKTTYVIPLAMQIEGPLQVGAMEAALTSLVARHESLRTTFPNIEGEPTQNVSPAVPLLLPVVETSTNPERLDALMAEEMQRGFDLERGPLFRAVLYGLGPNEHVLLLLQHHIISDAWSLNLMTRELGTLYGDAVNGRASALPELSVQYRDYSRWLRESMQGETLDQQLEYWRSQLAGAPQVLDLPTDRPRPSMESHRGAIFSFAISHEVSQGLAAISRREGITLYMLLLAAFDVLLWRYTGQEDLLVGVPIANRDRRELEGLIGLFVNTLVLRNDLSGDPTVQELLARVRERCLDAYAHQELPVEMLVEDLQPARDLSRNPLFQVMLVLENASQRPTFTAPGLKCTPMDADRGATHLDLTLYVEEKEEELKGIFEYATDFFDESSIERMAGHWHAILEAIISNSECHISELTVLNADERQQLLVEWNATENDFPREAYLHQLMERQALRVPEKVAVICKGETLTYRELDQQANRFAHALREREIGIGQHVGVCVERSTDMLAAVLGILKVGAAYVPLDPSFPDERLRFMAEDAELALLVSTSTLAEPFGLPREQQLLLDTDADVVASQSDQPLTLNAESDASPEDPAYVIYTSGSTGKPKGVVVPHRAVVNFLTSMAREPSLTENDVLVAVTTLSFDISVLELQLPLAVGATVVIASHDESVDGDSLKTLLETNSSSVMQATPVTWRLLLEAGWTGGAAFKALVGGEALPVDLADQLIANDIELWNMYGPTETTVWSTCARITDTSNGITIGRPIDNTSIYILDAQKNICPIGVPGELYIGGDGVTLGYWKRLELTDDRYIPNPFGTASDALIYGTGDKARWLSDGTLEHLGRLDDQVKVRGYRVELGEIEARIAEHPDVRQVAAHLWSVSADDVRIVACCVPETHGRLASVSLRKHLRSCLPEYMIPQYFLPVDEIPLTPNGKADRRQLPTPTTAESSLGQHEAPANPVEVSIADIWTELIQPARSIGRNDKFFDMGGHSLLALRALRQMEQKLGVSLDFRVLFQESLADIASRCQVPEDARERA